MASDTQDLQRQIDDLLAVVRFHQKTNSDYMDIIRDESIKADKGQEERFKTLEKDVSDLKSRVKELETKLGKMGKK